MEKYPLIKEIKSPEDLKMKDIKELNDLTLEIRRFLLDKVSLTGGHLASNLGVCEAIVALHYVFDSPKDKIIFDVGHQAYVHKILTGRSEMFDLLRTKNGISGFLKCSESEHDCFEAGHSSTSIPAMCGFLEAKKTNKEIGEVISFIGDASFQNGLSLSSINYLASQKDQKGIIILNDNEMSISENIGGLANVFNRIRIRKSYKVFRKIVPKRIRNALKGLVYGNVSFFNQLGYRYIGPIDGHNIKELVKYYTFAKQSKESVIIHIKTIKGKGYKFSEEDKIGLYHGVNPFDIDKGIELNKSDKTNFGFGASQIISNLVKNNDKIRILTPAMIYGTGLTSVKEQYPEKVIDVGICEENSIIMASSMAKCGLIPIVMTYSTFFQRAYDEINHDITRTNARVIMIADRAGIVSGDGDTHQGIFDISMLMPLPNLIISSPIDLSEFKSILNMSITDNKPYYIRYPKCKVENNTDIENLINNPITDYKWDIISDIKKINIISYGPVLKDIKKTYQDCGVINARFIKPIDMNILIMLKNTHVIVYETVIKTSSLGETLRIISDEYKLNIDIYTISLDNYVGTGTLEELEQLHNVTIQEIEKIKNRIIL